MIARGKSRLVGTSPLDPYPKRDGALKGRNKYFGLSGLHRF